MKFLTVRDLRGKSAQVWRELPNEKEMVVTSNGRPVAVLTAVDESNVEQTLAAWRQHGPSRISSATRHERARTKCRWMTSTRRSRKLGRYDGNEKRESCAGHKCPRLWIAHAFWDFWRNRAHAHIERDHAMYGRSYSAGIRKCATASPVQH